MIKYATDRVIYPIYLDIHLKQYKNTLSISLANNTTHLQVYSND